MNAPTIDRVSDTLQDAAHTVQEAAHTLAERAPDVASAVGRGARSAAGTVSHKVEQLAAKTPWIEAPKPKRHGPPMLVRIAMIAAIAGIAMWFVNRRRHEQQYGVDEGTMSSDAAAPQLSERRFATAGR